jgi:3-hydroxyacyl-CoA dehydrogenase
MKSRPFQKVCVIGSGVMGSGIAAHLANARVPVLLLDIVPPKHSEKDPPKESEAFRNAIVNSGLKAAKKIKPAAFFSKHEVDYVEVGNLEDDLEKVKDCDWVIEVVVENMDIKRALFEKLEGVVHDEAIVSSNTSGLSISGMLEGRGDAFKKRFLVTHFFNPVRYLELLELVPGEHTDPAILQRVKTFGEKNLGKGTVVGKDTTNFIANRVGCYAMMETMRVMMEDGFTIEEVDAIFGPALGRPKSAVFRTADVVGLDTFVHVSKNCADNLQHDECHSVFVSPPWLEKMVQEGYLGQKSKKGFYKKEGKEIHVLDAVKLKDGIFEYKPKAKVRYDSLGAIRSMEDLSEKISTLVYADDRAAQFAWKVVMATAVYAANRYGEIAESIVDIDNGVKWGFRYEQGPFEAWDAIGVARAAEKWKAEGNAIPDWVQTMLSSGRESFYAFDDDGNQTVWNPSTGSVDVVERDPQCQTFLALKREKSNVVKDGFAASLVDLGDGVLACEFHSKMNALDKEIMDSLNEGLDLCDEGKFDALVIANDGQNFCVGANILMIFMAAQQQQWDELDRSLSMFQNTMARLKYSQTPTVAAPFQLTLGGGAEVALWCNRIRAHAETYMGLVEVGVGLLPGAGGNIEMLDRALTGALDSPTYPVEQLIGRAFETIAMAKVSTSVEEARDLLFLAPSDTVTMNRAHLLEGAKQEALGMVRAGFRPPRPRTYRLPGKSGVSTIEMMVRSMRDGGFISEHDMKIALKIGHVLTGGDCSPRQKVSEQTLLDLEREAFLSLCGEEKSMARIAHMLEKNKPLRN